MEGGKERGSEGGREMVDCCIIIIPSISTWIASLRMLNVENSTSIENKKVQLGSAAFHSGCRCQNHPFNN